MAEPNDSIALLVFGAIVGGIVATFSAFYMLASCTEDCDRSPVASVIALVAGSVTFFAFRRRRLRRK
ncbi:MAG TPA: hypothetical protein VGG74_08890 [Kofleriaceae bacterium]|jgi:hypothetical protein